jgi:hypothetical protein
MQTTGDGVGALVRLGGGASLARTRTHARIDGVLPFCFRSSSTVGAAPAKNTRRALHPN